MSISSNRCYKFDMANLANRAGCRYTPPRQKHCALTSASATAILSLVPPTHSSCSIAVDWPRHEASSVPSKYCAALKWRVRGDHPAPRLQDLRHSFVCHRLQEWYARGLDVDRS